MPSNIVPCLWFDGQAEEAANFYVSIFKDGKITSVQRYTDAGKEIHGHKAGDVMLVAFEINGQPFTILNGGPQFKINEAISFQIMCEDQAEVDHYWNKLGEGGDPAKQQCGWVGDKYGLSWQVVPKILDKLIADPEPEKSRRTLQAMMDMKKLDISSLKAAYEGK
ncbi:putative 3-demethylubiquinone-9 3-methyltransferase [Cadophora sp. MPI-SDFR-AT-0126]|nr:putative 3-demethylubiquinone-9 3-methyltransferase [Leotiomycetes sp. MPI-SDFR-AT-0126]